MYKRISCEKLKYDAFGSERKKKSNLIREINQEFQLSWLEQSHSDSVQVDSQDSSRNIQEQKDALDENDEDFLKNALGLISDIIAKLPTDEELEQFINLDCSEEINLNFYNICKGLPDSCSAEESPISFDNSLLSSFESDCYVAVCSMTNETESFVHEGDNMHHNESSDMNDFIQSPCHAGEKHFKQI